MCVCGLSPAVGFASLLKLFLSRVKRFEEKKFPHTLTVTHTVSHLVDVDELDCKLEAEIINDDILSVGKFCKVFFDLI